MTRLPGTQVQVGTQALYANLTFAPDAQTSPALGSNFGLVRRADVEFPLSWYVAKRLCRHKPLLLAYVDSNSTSEAKQFLESLDAWQKCP